MSPSGFFDPCGTLARMVTPKGSMSTEGHSKFLSDLIGALYGHSWWRGRCQSCNQVPATQIARVWRELDYRIDICRVTKGGHIKHL